MTDKLVALSTAANAGEAARIARHLVDRRVAACVSIVPGIQSVYRWKGNVEESAEWLLVIKSRRDLAEALMRELRAVHSYEVPELLMLPVVDGLPEYLAWMEGELPPPLKA